MTTAIDTKKLALEISRLGSHVIRGAHMAVFGANSTSIGDMATNLAGAVARGDTTLAAIKGATPIGGTVIPVGSTDSSGNSTASIQALQATANRAMDTALDANALSKTNNTGLTDLATRVSTVADMAIENCDKLVKLERSISQKLGEVKGEVDPVILQAQVAKAVADTFAPFKQAVQPEMMTVLAEDAGVYVTETKSVREVFGVDARDVHGNVLTVDVWNHPNTPAIDPNFIWTVPILRQLLLSQSTGEHLWFGGEKGTGKSETARQFAARTGRNYVRINFHKYTTAEDYLGAVGLVNGETVFQPKDFLMAYTSPSTVILLDEVTNADAGELAPLNGFLEPNSAVSYGGAVRRKANGVLVFAADNTLGNGDDSGRYAGTRTMNSALVDRFARVVHFEYLPLAQEVEAVVRHTGCTEDLARHVLKAVHVARSKVSTGDIVDAPSIRSVIGFIRALKVLNVDTAWASAVVNRQPAESHAALASVFAACIDPDFINKQLGGV